MFWPLRGMSAMPSDCHNNLALQYHRTRASALAVSRLMRSLARSTTGQLHAAQHSAGGVTEKQISPGLGDAHDHHCRSSDPDDRLVRRDAGADRGVDRHAVTGGETGMSFKHGLLAPMRNGIRLAASGCALRDVEHLDTCPIWAGSTSAKSAARARHVRADDRNHNAGAGF